MQIVRRDPSKKVKNLSIFCSDPITRGQERLFLNLVPTAKEVTIRGAGHFLQVNNALAVFLKCRRYISYKNEVGVYYSLQALTDHFEGGSRVYSFDPYW
jgi:hypothetical protein